MKVYTRAVRNVAFVGHSASGKTSLVDALAFVAGSSRRHGMIGDGTTLTDYTPDEINASTPSVSARVAEWMDTNQPDRAPDIWISSASRRRRSTLRTPRWWW
jgi:elongation factor G